jgi:hypothetical protein
LGNHCIGAANVSDKVAKGDRVETFRGVIEIYIINIVDGRHEKAMRDGVKDDVCVPRVAFGKVGSSSSFASRSGSGQIDGIFRRRRTRNCE